MNLYLEGNLCPDSFTQFLIAETPTLWVLASRVGGFRSSTTSLTIAHFSASLKSLALFGLDDFKCSPLLNFVQGKMGRGWPLILRCSTTLNLREMNFFSATLKLFFSVFREGPGLKATLSQILNKTENFGHVITHEGPHF